MTEIYFNLYKFNFIDEEIKFILSYVKSFVVFDYFKFIVFELSYCT